MAITGVTGADSTNYPVQTSSDNGLGQDEFMKVLVEELKNQNPLDPASNTDFVVQMVQFQLLEQMQEMGKAYAANQALGLIGKTVVAQFVDDTTGAVTYIEGEVIGVLMNDGNPLLQIGDYLVSVDSVVAATNIDPADAADGTDTTSGDDTDGTDTGDSTDETQEAQGA